MGCRGTTAEMGLKILNQVVVHCFVFVLTSSMGGIKRGTEGSFLEVRNKKFMSPEAVGRVGMEFGCYI